MEATETGYYDSPWGRHLRLQVLTVGQLLDGRGIDYPHVTGANVTHRRAARVKASAPDQTALFESNADRDRGAHG
jgi:hypothetical protein